MTSSVPARSFNRPLIGSHAIAVVLAATSVALASEIFSSWVVGPPLLFLCVIMLVALVAGPGPAALTSVLTFLSLQYSVLSPGHPFVFQSDEIFRLGLFIVASGFVVVLSSAQKRASISLQLLRSEQQSAIRELQEQNERHRVEIAEAIHAVQVDYHTPRRRIPWCCCCSARRAGY